MALTSWKTLDFFEVSSVQPPDDESKALFSNNDISCVCAGVDSLFIGTHDGTVHVLGSTFAIQRSFHAHDVGSIMHMKSVEGTELLVTVAEDLSHEPVMRVWALDKIVKKTGLPTCQSTLHIQNGRKPFPISAFTTSADLSQLAVGFANGAVTVVRGDLIHDRGAKQRTVFESPEPITGVEFRDEGQLMMLYIATTNRIVKLVISGKGQGQSARTLEDSGCGVGCMTVDKQSGDILVVRDDAIYFYNSDGRGNCFAYDGPKSLVQTYEDYVAIVAPPAKAPEAKSSTLRSFGGAQADDLFHASTFTLLEPVLKIIAYSESLVSQPRSLFMVWDDLFVLTQDGKIKRYHEKPLQQRLELLYQRNLYTHAISLAQKAGSEDTRLNTIYRKYGDYLYQKGDYDTAMEQYLKAIDNTEPSQVIRKFLDTQRIHNLIEYLEELHEHHKATADHTTLLLNCYAKLKDIDKLEKFIKSPGDLKFDLDTAISMCRQGGYYDQAAYLATKHDEHELVVDILIEDSKKYDEALQYICRLDANAAYPNLMKYARVLLENCPDSTTKVFIDYYIGNYKPKVDDVVVLQEPAPESGYAASAANAVQNLTNLLPLPYMNTAAVVPSAISGNVKPTISEAPLVEAEIELSPPPTYTPPQPRSAFSSFVDHPDQFITFLEACLNESGVEERDKIDLYTTLFEIYLYKASERKGHDREIWEAKAKKLVSSSSIPIDTSNVLLLSTLSDFKDGTTLVREKAGLVFDIFRSYTTAKDTRGAIKALHKYGEQEPMLYPAALAYFTSDSQILDDAGDELDEVLKKIDEDGLMAPLQVIQTLSTNGVATMGMVKAYLQQTIDRERKEIASNRKIIDSYRNETASKRTELAELTTKPAIFQASRCSVCGAQLDLPAVHFLCKHSFHARCLNVQNGQEDKAECPVCRSGNETIKAIRKAQEESADRHDVFKEALGRSHDRFATVSEFFGRGVMNVPGMD